VREGDVDASPYRDYLAALQGCLTDEAVVVGDQPKPATTGLPNSSIVGTATIPDANRLRDPWLRPSGRNRRKTRGSRTQCARSEWRWGFLFTMQELATAVAETLAIPIVIFNMADTARFTAT